MGVLLVDADDVRRQQLGTVLSFMGIPWQEVVESDLDVAIETAGPLQGILAGELRERALSELLAALPLPDAGEPWLQQLHRGGRGALYL